MSVVLMVMLIKITYSPWTSPDLMAEYLVLVSRLKPVLTFLTVVFFYFIRYFFPNWRWDWEREINVLLLSYLLGFSFLSRLKPSQAYLLVISLALSLTEIFSSLQVRQVVVLLEALKA